MAFRITALLLGLLNLSQALQFCQRDSTKHIDACLGITTAASVFSESTDTHFTIRAKFEHRRGWVSFGIGSVMADAVMFVLYPGVNPDHITVSVRTAPGHAKPIQDPRLPEIEIQSISNPETDVYNVYFICKTCAAVIPAFNAESLDQPFIWAANTQQVLGTGDKNATLEFHKDGLFGVFNLDMTRSPSPKGTSPMPIILTATANTPSTSQSSTFSLARIHGLLASLSLLLFPLGIYLLRRKGTNGFKQHWITQTIGASILLIGCIIGFGLSLQRRSFGSVHQMLGIVLMVAFSGQLYSGYMHHRNFARYQRRTKVSHVHIWSGRGAMFVGVLNVFFGCRLAMVSYQTFAVFLAIWAVEGFVFLLPSLRKRNSRKEVSKYNQLTDFRSSEDTIAAEHEAFSIEDDSEVEDERISPKDGDKGSGL